MPFTPPYQLARFLKTRYFILAAIFLMSPPPTRDVSSLWLRHCYVRGDGLNLLHDDPCGNQQN